MYHYETQKPKIFTEYGFEMFIKIRDRTHSLLKEAGACRMTEMMKGTGGDSWTMMACVDRMVEMGEIWELTDSRVMGQDRVFTWRHQ